jgi:hypothetical protein
VPLPPPSRTDRTQVKMRTHESRRVSQAHFLFDDDEGAAAFEFRAARLRRSSSAGVFSDPTSPDTHGEEDADGGGGGIAGGLPPTSGSPALPVATVESGSVAEAGDEGGDAQALMVDTLQRKLKAKQQTVAALRTRLAASDAQLEQATQHRLLEEALRRAMQRKLGDMRRQAGGGDEDGEGGEVDGAERDGHVDDEVATARLHAVSARQVSGVATVLAYPQATRGATVYAPDGISSTFLLVDCTPSPRDR